MIPEDAIIVAPEDLTVADLSGEAVILDMKSNKYYGLNETGARIFNLVKEARPVNEVVAIMLQEYEGNGVEPEQLKSDLLGFLQKMLDKQLVQLVHETTA